MNTNGIQIGLELYSVRNEIRQNLEATLSKISAMGYNAVEFAGKMLYEPSRTAKALKDSGLYCSSAHVPFDSLFTSDEEFERTAEYHAIIENKYLILNPPIMSPRTPLPSLTEVLKLAEDINELALKLKQFGMYTGYHNHSKEFVKLPDSEKNSWQILYENTDSDVIIQLDTGNAISGNADIISELEYISDREIMIHLKPFSHERGFISVIGEQDDANDYERIFKFYGHNRRKKPYIIEFEGKDGLYPEFQAAELCITNLKERFGSYI